MTKDFKWILVIPQLLSLRPDAPFPQDPKSIPDGQLDIARCSHQELERRLLRSWASQRGKWKVYLELSELLKQFLSSFEVLLFMSCFLLLPRSLFCSESDFVSYSHLFVAVRLVRRRFPVAQTCKLQAQWNLWSQKSTSEPKMGRHLRTASGGKQAN